MWCEVSSHCNIHVFTLQPSQLQPEPVRKEKAPPPPPTPKPNPKSIARAQNPVALRYWNQCLSQAQQAEVDIPQHSQSVIAAAHDEGNVPWALPDTSRSGPTRGEGKMGNKFKINVPDINRQIQSSHNGKTDWASILAEDEAHQNKLRSVRVSGRKQPRAPHDYNPPPKYAWMKSPANRNPPHLSETSAERQKSECYEGASVRAKQTDRQHIQVNDNSITVQAEHFVNDLQFNSLCKGFLQLIDKLQAIRYKSRNYYLIFLQHFRTFEQCSLGCPGT